MLNGRRGNCCYRFNAMEVRLVVARDGNKQHVLAVGRLYFAAVDNAVASGEENDFDEHRRVEG